MGDRPDFFCPKLGYPANREEFAAFRKETEQRLHLRGISRAIQEEAVSEASEALLRRRLAGEPLKSWQAFFFRCARFTARSLEHREWRRKQALGRHMDAQRGMAEPTDELAASGEMQERLISVVSQLDPLEREIVYRHIWSGLSFHDIAKELGSSKSAVFHKYATAFRKIRRSLRAETE